MPRTSRKRAKSESVPKIEPEYGAPFGNNKTGTFEVSGMRVVWAMQERFRRGMEDRLGMAENETHLVLGVFDGHGGYELAQWCAQRVCDQVAQRGFEHVQTILEEADASFAETYVTCACPIENRNVGTTATIAVIQKAEPHKADVAWLGDSRASAYDAAHKRVWRSIDHDLYNAAEVKGVEERGGKVVGKELGCGPRIADRSGNPCLNMSRALGNADLAPWVSKHAQIGSVDAYKTLVIATDGLWNSMDDREMLIRDDITEDSVKEALNHYAYEDNIAFFIVSR